MDSNVVECEAGREVCGCKGGPSLAILKEVQRAYEERMQIIDRVGGANKLQMQVEVLRSWVSDLVGQNTLLVRTVEDLESEATTQLLLERRRHSERDKKRKVCADWSELKILNDSLQKENIAKDREIQRLNKDIQQYERTIINLRSEMALRDASSPEVLKKDAEVTAAMCCTGNECGDWEPVKDYSAKLEDDQASYQDRIVKMEAKLKSSCETVRTLRKMNVAFKKEMESMRGVCAALHEQCLAVSTEVQFKDDVIKEMRRQLRKAKAKLKELSDINTSGPLKDYVSGDHDFGRSSTLSTYESVMIECVSQQPRRNCCPVDSTLELPPMLCPSDVHSLKLEGSDDDMSIKPD
ncbi:uncharacterized protein LOC113510465 [Galleria mellonella]|uniref:Uncharacterized protein LOC113510465 n=1 Tax=Galleria mellonella TaxID=7137 RepID=A0ABM3MZW7_GALME|nr:uncharacterized protein LOC113510465 [Galleria mellonella]